MTMVDSPSLLPHHRGWLTILVTSQAWLTNHRHICFLSTSTHAAVTSIRKEVDDSASLSVQNICHCVANYPDAWGSSFICICGIVSCSLVNCDALIITHFAILIMTYCATVYRYMLLAVWARRMRDRRIAGLSIREDGRHRAVKHWVETGPLRSKLWTKILTVFGWELSKIEMLEEFLVENIL